VHKTTPALASFNIPLSHNGLVLCEGVLPVVRARVRLVTHRVRPIIEIIAKRFEHTENFMINDEPLPVLAQQNVLKLLDTADCLYDRYCGDCILKYWRVYFRDVLL